MKHNLVVLLVGLGAVLPAPALAQQFTFVVPVHVANVPIRLTPPPPPPGAPAPPPAPYLISRYQVACWIYVGDPRAGGFSLGSGIWGTEIPIASRTADTVTFDAEVRVTIPNVPMGHDPAAVTHYRCDLSFPPFFLPDTPASQRFPIAAGQPFMLSTGVLPMP
jgi:hypothetical protein